ncbi:hypothetical protein GF386_03410, partial [Candidatus Pacearchaeota archaeon]|nr:hypothetical protein [Candidatus Pacearchaeota archaeon]MBD3283189.1 hypothetical protein [Candidatus Pacearchaeota archaeon]
MRIDFFEEFPDKDLKKAKLINFNSTIYIAANSFDDFKKYKKRLKEINPRLEAAYWPFFKKSCWISPFSYTVDLKKFIKDIEEKNKGKKL